MIRGWAYKFALICLVFVVSYLINVFLIFAEQPQPWGQYTALMVTFMAVILSAMILWLGRGGAGK